MVFKPTKNNAEFEQEIEDEFEEEQEQDEQESVEEEIVEKPKKNKKVATSQTQPIKLTQGEIISAIEFNLNQISALINLLK